MDENTRVYDPYYESYKAKFLAELQRAKGYRNLHICFMEVARVREYATSFMHRLGMPRFVWLTFFEGYSSHGDFHLVLLVSCETSTECRLPLPPKFQTKMTVEIVRQDGVPTIRVSAKDITQGVLCVPAPGIAEQFDKGEPYGWVTEP